MSRTEYAPQPTAEDTARNMAESARDTDIEIAVRAEKQNASRRGMQLSDDAALQNVYQRIDVDGVEAVLPRFARIVGRMRGNVYEGDSAPRRPRTNTSTRPIADARTNAEPSQAASAQSEIMKLNAANKADLAAGRPPDPKNYQRIEELRKLL